MSPNSVQRKLKSTAGYQSPLVHKDLVQNKAREIKLFAFFIEARQSKSKYTKTGLGKAKNT